ncbi:MAG: thermonuclease family protein [Thermodesulfovibrionales bacterium]|nr:thermonuclease family protein [Thermodesulfovibrionales bacterium]
MPTKKNRRIGNLIAMVVFLLVAGFYVINEKYPFAGKQEEDPYVFVIAVNDGDTVSVLLGRKKEKIRLIGIDAPEMGQQPWGEGAKNYLESILNASGQKVRIERDVEERDTYGRTLAYLWTTKGEMVNVMMVRGGYAMLYTFPPNVRYVHELTEAQTEARNARAGVWSENGLQEKPGDYRKEHPRK